MAKKLQIMLSDEAELIMKNLKSKTNKEFFYFYGYKALFNDKRGKKFPKGY